MRDHAKKFIAYLLVIILSFVGFRAAFHSSSSARTLSQDYDDPKPKQRVNSSKMLDDQSQMQWLHQKEGTDDDGILLASSLLPIVKTTTSDRSAAYTRPFSDRRNLLENFSTTNERGPDSDTQGYNSIHGDVLEPEEVPYNYSGGASPYNSITEGQEDYLADFIIQDENEMNFHSARILSVSSSTVGDFRALHCNSNLNGAPCTLLSETNTAAEPYVVPCGACYLFDLTDGQVHEFPGGIDIKGKLKFAVNKKVTVRTPFVIVQGELEVSSSHDIISKENESVAFHLTGTNDVLFSATDSPNQDACAQQPSGKCNLGAKPFFVAGGTLNIDAFPSNCKTHSKILKKTYTNRVRDPDNYPKFEKLPDTCNGRVSEAVYVNYDFNDGLVGDWTASRTEKVSADTFALVVSERQNTWDGPELHIDNPGSCLSPNKEYLFSVRLKFDKSDASSVGQPTTCATTGDCPRLYMISYGPISHSTLMGRLSRYSDSKYGEFVHFTGSFKLHENNFLDDQHTHFFRIQDINTDVDITIDDFRIELPPASLFPASNEICNELIVNGNAEILGPSHYPMTTLRSSSYLSVVQDEGSSNSYFRLTQRSDQWSSMISYVDTNCLRRGDTYLFSMKVRIHSETARAYKIRLDSPHYEIALCPPQKYSDGWVTCSEEFTVNDRVQDFTSPLKWQFYFVDGGITADVDYDDVSLKNLGYVSNLVVAKEDARCWGEGSEVHIGSSVFYSFTNEMKNGDTAIIKSIHDNNDGTVSLELDPDTAPTIPIITSEDDPTYAADVALVSRNVVIEGESGEENKGAYLQVMHTLDILQKISGVQFNNMGRRSEEDRFGLQILYSGSLVGTEITWNSFHKSNHRCIVLEGSHNIIVSGNVGVSNSGHCVFLDWNSRDNTVSGNYVSDTRAIESEDTIPESSDRYAAAFYSKNGPNSFTNNIAVASRFHGFQLTSDHQIRQEDLTWERPYDPRLVALGPFLNNEAKSNGGHGIYFRNNRQSERLELTNLKVLKNRYHGFYAGYGQRVTIKDSYFGENQIGIEMKYVDDIEILDTSIVGLTDATKLLIKAPHFHKPCMTDSYYPWKLTGYLMHTTIWRFDAKLPDQTYLPNVGASLKRVSFSGFDHDDEEDCNDSLQIKFNSNQISDGHWNFVSSFEDVSFEGSRILDAVTAQDDGVKDIVITDVGGFSDPSGQASTTSSFVSNRPQLTTFAGGACSEYWQGIAYCENTCYRTLTVRVDQYETDTLVMKVTRSGDNLQVSADQYYQYDGSEYEHRKRYEGHYRKFSIPLPAGTYKIDFFDGIQPSWPRYAYEVWEGKPECTETAYANGPDVTIEVPPADNNACDQLVRNSDMSMGTTFWNHRNDRDDTSRGYIMEMPGKGRSGSKAIGHFERINQSAGIGQNLDTRCLHQNPGSLYEVTIWFRRELDGIHQECNRFTSDDATECPWVRIKNLLYEDDSTKEAFIVDYPIVARKVMTSESNDYELIHGVFQIDDKLEESQRAWIYMENMYKSFDMIVDEFKVDRLTLLCAGNLVRNGDLETGYSTFWDSYGTFKFNIVNNPFGGRGIEIKDKPDVSKAYYGIEQHLYIDGDCFIIGDRYQIIAKFRMKNAQGSDIGCDLHANYGDLLYCGIARLEFYIPEYNNKEPYYKNRHVSYPAAMVEGNDGWSVLAGAYALAEEDLYHTKLKLRLVDTHPDVTVIYDDISMTKIPKTCDQMILNPSFGDGTSSFWKPSYQKKTYYTIIPSTPSNVNEYALLYNRGEGNSWEYMTQDLDARCFSNEGDELRITAKMKLVDSNDWTTGFGCDNYEWDYNKESHCPTITFHAWNCDDGWGGEFNLQNENQEPWSTTGYNSFQYDIVIDSRLASCENFKIGVGRYTPLGRSLVVSEIKFGMKPVTGPVDIPSSLPATINTISPNPAPVPRPVSTVIKSCPPVGAYDIVDEGSIVLVRSASLCTLTKITLDGSGSIHTSIPLARSYHNHDWEVSAGELASTLFVDGIVCRTSGCQVDLISIPSNSQYRLTSYSKTLSNRDTFARFLETATFGTLSGDLVGANGQNSQIISWIKTQMDTGSTPITSHRRFWRERVSPRLPVATLEGIPDHPCHQHSRWRKFTFTQNDALHWMDKEMRVEGTGPYTLYLDGIKRTIVEDFWPDRDTGFEFDPNYMYVICRLRVSDGEKVGGKLSIKLPDGRCVTVPNPPVNLTSIEGDSTILDLHENNLEPIDEYYNSDEFILQNPLTDPLCAKIPDVFEHGDEKIFGRLPDGTWLQFDPRLELQSNSLESPLPDGGKNIKLKSGGETQCSNVPRTFLNEDSCVPSSNSCQISETYEELEIFLDDTAISKLHTLTGRYVYRIIGLNVVDQSSTSNMMGSNMLEHPCTKEMKSRWIPKASTCNPTVLGSGTHETLHDLLSTTSDLNPNLRDIHFPSSGKSCDASDTNPEIEILVDGVCWKRVHDDYLSVYDMSYWVDNHPGGPDKITKWAENGGTMLVFPNSHHPMERWVTHSPKFSYLGRFGDFVRIRDLPNDLRTEAVINFYMDSTDTGATTSLVCGSPGEVKNEPTSGFIFDISNGYESDRYDTSTNRLNVWLMANLQAKDQLRQRVAWSLAQIIVVVTGAIGDARHHTEWFFTYYDIFVRNAFGNYRDILREISYNPLMAENLSFLKSKSSAYLWETNVKAQADENFAREIMQLFSMGINLLNMDGTLKLDKHGKPQLAYTNDDIESLSRAWTGFDLQRTRSNTEGGTANRIDPMRIQASWRDRFPKTDTVGGYVGDGYPLCVDLPEKAFLKKGAVYRYLGNSPMPQLMSDPSKFATDETVKRFALSPSSQLYGNLCNGNSGSCNFQRSVVLESSLSCFADECNVDTVRVVQVEDSFFEYVQVPCVRQAFYEGSRKINKQYGWDSSGATMCANPNLPEASTACCEQLHKHWATRTNIFDGERMLFSTAESRCSELEGHKELCDFVRVRGDDERHKNSNFFWTTDTCDIKVKVNIEGKVAIVQRPRDYRELVKHIQDGNENYFKVFWKHNNFPQASRHNCGNCDALDDGSCLCSTFVSEQQVFQEAPSSKRIILQNLFIGAPDPSTFAGANAYSSSYNSATGIRTYVKNSKIDKNTIFEFADEKGRQYRLKNTKEIVMVQNGDYSFRNAPHFMSMVKSEETRKDAQYETEATLDQYFYHDNTAPFLAVRLIQRLVTSNPSPRYILSVSTAFKEGRYNAENSHVFGTGRYGDMAAMFAAIYLDREARSVVLDKDPTFGSLREPILKVMNLMRSMEFKSNHPVTILSRVKRYMGQKPHDFETVFSFFLPEYKPFGRVGDAKLVSPEATLLDMPKIVGTINALRSLVKFGLSSCEGGFGWQHCHEREYLASPLGGLQYLVQDPKASFSQETFEGPSLKGGLDNEWVGRYYRQYKSFGKVVVDPLDQNNHVYLPSYDWQGRFYSPPHDKVGNTVVKFKFYATQEESRATIGYTTDEDRLVSQTWMYIDSRHGWAQNRMYPTPDAYISCQFEIPSDISQFRVVIGKRGTDGLAYFDDIHVTSGTGTQCGVTSSSLTPHGTDGFGAQLVDDLATLLTAGRLSQEHRSMITDAYDKAGSANDGLKTAQELILSSSEFHTTNNVKPTAQKREEVNFPEPGSKPYRAVVYIMLNGGADSYNMLAPHTCTQGYDLYQDYVDVRQSVALSTDDLLPISADNQVCERFGIHPELMAARDLYNDKDLLFFANTGVMSRPVTKRNYWQLTNVQLFAHNHMQRESKIIDPYDTSSGTGVLGRMADILTGYGSNVGAFSVDRYSVAIVGQPGVSATPMIVNRDGVPPVYVGKSTKQVMRNLHNSTYYDSGYFGDMWSAAFIDSLNINEVLKNEMDGIQVQTEFPSSYLSTQLKTVSKLIASRNARGVDFDTFYVEVGGYDTHSNVEENLRTRFIELNEGIGAFSSELKQMGLWNNVVTIQTSDFARTLNPNSGDGTDHAWGGNYMMFGGAVKGGKILGEYPPSFDEDNGEWILSRGRVIPTTPWDAVFKGIARWVGVPVHKQHDVCPNLRNFNTFKFEDDDMFYFGPGSSCSTNQDCDDNNDLGTNDICDEGICKNEVILGVCGNGICEPSYKESCSSCVKDCIAPFYCNKLGQGGDFEGEQASSDVQGILFDIKASRGLAISGIDVRVTNGDPIGGQVFIKKIPTVQRKRRLQEDLSTYTKVYDEDEIPLNEDGTVTLNFPGAEVELEAGDIASIYTTFDQSGRLMYQGNLKDGEVAKSNEDVQIFAGQTSGNDITDIDSDSDAKTLVGTLNYQYINLDDATLFPTQSPAPPTPFPDGSGGGDPHFKTFSGDYFSYHGECDLVLLKSLGFASGLGLHIHIRTTRVNNPVFSFSYISGVAVKLGDDILEAMSDGLIFVNGEEVSGDITFAGFSVSTLTKGVHGNIHVYDLNLDFEEDNSSIEIRANKKSGILFVDVKGVFSDSAGLLGTGTSSVDTSLLARDRVTDLNGQWNTYGEEWQVRDTEMKLFRENRPPQFPAGCRYESNLKKPKRLRRRQRHHRHLMEEVKGNEVALEVAREACSRAFGRQKDFCIADVMATGQLEVAQDPFYY